MVDRTIQPSFPPQVPHDLGDYEQVQQGCFPETYHHCLEGGVLVVLARDDEEAVVGDSVDAVVQKDSPSTQIIVSKSSQSIRQLSSSSTVPQSKDAREPSWLTSLMDDCRPLRPSLNGEDHGDVVMVILERLPAGAFTLL